MTLEEIKAAVDAGKTVHNQSEYYTVVKDKFGRYLIVGMNQYAIGLTWTDGVTMNGKPEEFFIGSEHG